MTDVDRLRDEFADEVPVTLTANDGTVLYRGKIQRVKPEPKRDAEALVRASVSFIEGWCKACREKDEPYEAIALDTVKADLQSALTLLRSERERKERVVKEMRTPNFVAPNEWGRQALRWADMLEGGSDG